MSLTSNADSWNFAQLYLVSLSSTRWNAQCCRPLFPIRLLVHELLFLPYFTVYYAFFWFPYYRWGTYENTLLMEVHCALRWGSQSLGVSLNDTCKWGACNLSDALEEVVLCDPVCEDHVELIWSRDVFRCTRKCKDGVVIFLMTRRYWQGSKEKTKSHQ